MRVGGGIHLPLPSRSRTPRAEGSAWWRTELADSVNGSANAQVEVRTFELRGELPDAIAAGSSARTPGWATSTRAR
jgi:hypothetical protein